MQNTDITFIYFDIGGVFFEWDKVFTTVANAFNLKQNDFLDLFDEVDEQITKGEITSTQFWQLCQERFDIHDGEDYNFPESWVSDYIPIQTMHAFASKAGKRYPIGVISNFYTELYPISIKQGMVPDLPFQPAIISCDVHMRKPESEIYQYAESLIQAEPKSILFIDDSQKSIDGATQAGWQTFLFDTYNPEVSINNLNQLLGFEVD